MTIALVHVQYWALSDQGQGQGHSNSNSITQLCINQESYIKYTFSSDNSLQNL